MDSLKQKILSLYRSRSERDWNIAMELEGNKDGLLDDWWKELEGYYIHNNKDEESEATRERKIKLLRFLGTSSLVIPFVPSQLIGEFRQLKTLTVEDVEATAWDFPAALLEVKHLEELNIESCRIPELPPRCLQLGNLQKLSLSKTAILTLPKGISTLKKLTTLNLNYCNKITALPSTFGKLPQLTTIHLEGIFTKKNMRKTSSFLCSKGFWRLLNRLPKLKKVHVGELSKEETQKLSELLPQKRAYQVLRFGENRDSPGLDPNNWWYTGYGDWEDIPI